MCSLGTFLVPRYHQRWTTMPSPHHICSPYLSWKRTQHRVIKNCFKIILYLLCAIWWLLLLVYTLNILTPCSAMSECGEPSLGRQMQAWLVVLARKAAACLVSCAERSNKRALCNIPLLVAPKLSPWVWRFRHGFSRGPTGFEIQRDVDAQVGKFQLAILQGGKKP